MKLITRDLQTVQNERKKTQYAAQSRVKQIEWRLLTLVLVLLDMLLIYLALQISYLVRFQTALSIFELDVIPEPGFYQNLILSLLPIWLLVYMFTGLYNRQNIMSGMRETALVFNAATICVVLVIAADFLKSHIYLARGWLITTWFLAFLFTALGRFFVRGFVRQLRSKGFLTSSALVVGANAEGRLLAEQLINPKYSGLRMVGFVDDTYPIGKPVFHGLQNLGGLSQLDEVISTHHVEEIIIASSALNEDQIVDLFSRYGVSSRTNIRLSTGLYQIITTGLEVNEFACVPLVKINRVRLTGANWLLKMVLDYAIAIPLALVLLPLVMLIGILIKLDSPGPIFYRRRVMGVNSRQFDAFKFRTMYVNGDELLNSRPDLKAELERTQKLKDDPRVTRVGRILRKASLDELPQMINVLRNEMSLVGPRMISPPEMTIYKQLGINLLTVKPGITGLWQVSGRSDVVYEDRIRLDMYYIRNWSIWLDLQLLWRTVPAVISRRGAY